MGENYFVLRQMPQAEKEFAEALHQRPEIPGLHLELGLVYAGAARWDKAEEEFRVETKMQPGNAEAAYRLGAALLQQGKAHEARQQLERANRLKPDMPETLYSLGKAASLDGSPAAAEKAWTRVIELEKESSLAAQAHFGLANLYRSKEIRLRRNRKCRSTRNCKTASLNPKIHRARGVFGSPDVHFDLTHAWQVYDVLARHTRLSCRLADLSFILSTKCRRIRA